MSEIQFLEMKALLQHAVDSSGVEYVWIDWSCVPQYSKDSMVEVHRSKVFYARARFMYILPTFEDLPEEGPVRVILAKAQSVLSSRASNAAGAGDAANETESLQCAVAESVIGAILEKNRTPGREYFGRVWTLAERMARHGRSEGLCNWLSLESWLGMVVDAMCLDRWPQPSGWVACVQAEACDGLEDKVAGLCVAAVGVWLSPSNLEEAPTREWLRIYLGQKARSGIYQAWSEADRVWAIYSYFCWKRLDQCSEAGLRMALDDLAETAGGDKGTYVQGMYTQLGLDASTKGLAAPEVQQQRGSQGAAKRGSPSESPQQQDTHKEVPVASKWLGLFNSSESYSDEAVIDTADVPYLIELLGSSTTEVHIQQKVLRVLRRPAPSRPWSSSWEANTLVCS
ncbi:hypothetical protein PLESTB_001292800 [Pleodorina starrii]|uniref:Heterokaryon incompatibility domain-containing protein n=1 Tax=Pleodorina starrii TaxID=330485 RepID=A0A9W6F6W7_9CHLO|nr:hypothetical protein PLESTB_001292800 [Pleodorina starrii]